MINRARGLHLLRNIIVSVGIAGVALAAFRLSFDAQTILAIASGADAGLGWIYPLTVDAAIVIVTLIALWSDDLARRLRIYLWAALALWTAASVAGNALHILALPDGRVTLPEPIAIAVNTVPAVTLFLTIHIATTTVFRRRVEVLPVRRSRAAAQVGSGANGTNGLEFPVRPPKRTDIPPLDVVELLRMADNDGMSLSQIASATGRSKSYVGAQIKTERDRRAAAA